MAKSLIRRLFTRRYLSRLILTITAIVLIPCSIGMVGIFSASYQQVSHANDEYYQDTLDHFTILFNEKIAQMVLHANQISIDSRDGSKAAYKMQRAALLEHPVNYYQIFLSNLSDYNYSSPGYTFGLYYPEYDILFHGSSKYSLDHFIKSLGIKNEQDPFYKKATDFFSTSGEAVRFLPYNSTSSMSYELLVGIPSTMGLDRDRVIFFYQMNRSSLSVSSIISESTYQAQFCLWDTLHDLPAYVCGYNNMSASELQENLDFSTESSRRIVSTPKTTYAIYTGQIDKYGFPCAVIIPQDMLTQNLTRFYTLALGFLITAIVLLAIMLIVTVRIVYKPVLHTLELIDADEIESDEFLTIDRTLMQMKNEILEQNQIVLDYLLNSLLHGTPISQKDAERTGLVMNRSCQVYVWEQIPLTTNERAELVTSLKSQMNTVAFVTDLLGSDRRVIICQFSLQQDSQQLEAWIRRWFADRFQELPQILSGEVVNSLNQLHDSYTSCFRVENDQVSAEAAVEVEAEDDHQTNARMQKLREDVEEYLAANYSDSALSQITVADHFGISTYSLSRLFSNVIGISFAQYISSLRLEEAKHLLEETELSIAEISREIGMSNPNYLSRVFKQNFGVTPVQYRKESGAPTKE